MQRRRWINMPNCSCSAVAGLSPLSPHPLPSCVRPPLTTSAGLSAALVVDHWSPRGLRPGHHALLSRSWQGRRKGLLVGLRIPHICPLLTLLALGSDIKCSGSGQSFRFSGTLVVSASKACPLWASSAQRCEERKHSVSQ